MEQYCIYLRKSRKDQEAELRGEGETLARHEKALLQLAHEKDLYIGAIYREIVSGETIAARPVVQQLLSEVEDQLWSGVLVMEVERLARGDTKDQGIIAETFKYGNAKIITPMKVYDPNNEFDEEYFEFGLFMSRREYKTINRRIQRGRVASIEEGKYISSVAPYGYERIKIENDKGYTLKPLPGEAEAVKMIFNWYVNGRMLNGIHEELGMYKIAGLLDELGIKPRHRDTWSRHTIKDILSNITYAGFLRWQWRPEVKSIRDGEIYKSRKKSADGNYKKPKGLHPALISMELFDAAQSKMSGRVQSPLPSGYGLKNPLAGILVCKKCGRTMMRTPPSPRRYESVRCPERTCNNVAAPLDMVERELLFALEEWLSDYEIEITSGCSCDPLPELELHKASLCQIEKSLKTNSQQIDRAYDLLEQGIYSTEVFLERSQKLKAEQEELQQQRAHLELLISEKTSLAESIYEIVPKVRHVLEVYWLGNSIDVKNSLLKEVLEKVEYEKDKPNKKGEKDIASFNLYLYPKLPRKD